MPGTWRATRSTSQEAIAQIEAGADEALSAATHLLSIGGDHTVALPLLRAMHRRHGPIALLHFDAHLDTWDTYFGAAYTHGTPFRRAWEEGLLLEDRATHVGIRGPLFSPEDLVDDARFGFEIVTAMDVLDEGRQAVADRIRHRLGDAPVYVSIDIDVLDPGIRSGDRDAGGGRPHEPRAPRDPPRPRRCEPRGGGHRRGCAAVRPRGGDAVAASHVAYELLALFAKKA